MTATNLQTQQREEIERLKVKLVEQTTNVEKELNAKLEASKERLKECSRMFGREVASEPVR